MDNRRLIGIGAMRLSTERDRDDDRSIATLHAAFHAGVTLVDTADAYCLDHNDLGHNERLIARALSTWSGDRSSVVVATKGGMTRPEGRWELDGRARHLRAACERSCRALNVSRIDLYQLHAPDPGTPLSTSVRALAALKRDGLVSAIGLCNVTVGQIEEARRITEIDAVQVELSILNDAAILGGVVGYCIEHQMRLLAHRPLGGRRALSRIKNHPELQRIATEHGGSPFDVALAWLCGLSDLIVPLPGATRIETAVASVLAQQPDNLTKLEGSIDASAFRRMGREVPGPQRGTGAEVAIVMGLPGAGKTTMTESFVADGYQRINRDDKGGTLRELTRELDRALADGASKIVLDNTYVSRKSRAEVILTAKAHGAAVRCVWLQTSVDDAQVNVAHRLITQFGKLPDPPPFFPTAQFRFQRELEPPDLNEGFSTIDMVPFVRSEPTDYTNRAVIVWVDDVDRAVAERLKRMRDDGYLILGMAWRPDVAAATFEELNALAGFAIEVEYCPHGAGPPRCWCRKPLPGLGVILIHRHRLDPRRCIYVGGGTADPGFARKLGFEFRQPDAL